MRKASIQLDLVTPLVALVLLIPILSILSLTFYGLYLAFSASIVLGIIALIVETSPLVFGIVMFFFDKNLPELIVNWLGKQ